MRSSKLLSCVRNTIQRRYKSDALVVRSCSSSAKPPEKDDSCGEFELKLDSNKKGLVLGIHQKDKELSLSKAAEEVDQKSGGKISQYMNQLSDELKRGKAFIVTDVLPEFTAVALSWMGPKESAYCELESLDEARENVRWCAGAGVRRLMERGCGAVLVDVGSAPDAAAEAAELAAWRFDLFKAPDDRRPACNVGPFGAEGGDRWREGAVRARAQNWARYLSDMPANKMTPADVAQAAIDRLCCLGIMIDAHDREWIEAQRMKAFLAVARGSCTEPMFLECSYKGGNDSSPPVLVVAKGVTFDSGGLCLKECESMTENRGSMAGAAVALASLDALARLKVPINVNVVIPLCENMVSGQCMKVGDVVQALNGLSIQIENTDFEGRLMMADALVYGQAVYKPSLVVDVATFTKGVLMATGGGAFGCFSNNDSAWRVVRRAGALSGDRPWRFPLWQYYHAQISNDPAVDLRNKGSGHATPCLGAAFLKNFICGDWVHMDITGVGKVAHFVAPPYLDPRRMTGRPCRTLTTMLTHIASGGKDNYVARSAQPPTKCMK
ncbi:cytosol aminopeptidase-like [Anticarsia gemmatalis]|uniref:cytosol aminopeptidase-like n=1 Tax=Anticarsia gemmatalis TaxID=129554 RepID=UPI003F75A1D9